MTFADLSPVQAVNVCRWALDLEPIRFGAKRAPRAPKKPRPLSTTSNARRRRRYRAKQLARAAAEAGK